MKKGLKNFLLSIVVVAGAVLLLGLVQAITDKGNLPDEKAQYIHMVLDCLPRYRNEQTIFTIVPHVDGEYLNCKRSVTGSNTKPNGSKPTRLIVAFGE